jgi:hypothetical protein
VGFSESVAVEFANAPVVEVAGKVSGPSLHAAIRRALKVDEDWPLVAYRNHAQLESFVFRFIEGLNTRLGDRADLLILRNEVDTDSIVGILRAVGDEIELEDPPVAVSRPGLRKVQGSGKFRSVIAAEVAAMAHVWERGFADVLGDFLVPGDSNLDLIKRIDQSVVSIDDERGVNWALAKEFSQAVMIWMKTAESSLVSDFCFSLFDEWSGVKDDELRRQLAGFTLRKKSAASD